MEKYLPLISERQKNRLYYYYHKSKIRVYRLLEGEDKKTKVAKLFHVAMLLLIFLNIIAVMLDSVEELAAKYSEYFSDFEKISVAVFSVEYVLRIWSCTVNKKYRGRFIGRFQFMLTPMAVIDLLAVAPFYIAFIEFDFLFLRVLRLLRIFRIFKLGRYSEAYRIIFRVINAKVEFLSVTLLFVLTLTILSSCLMYVIEHEAQPEIFSSIPATMWWAIITMTTVGYGDVYPATIYGKMLSSVIAMLGIGLFALPAGIVASGFLTELESRKQRICCPHCHKEIE